MNTSTSQTARCEQAPQSREEMHRRLNPTKAAVLNYVGRTDDPKPARSLALRSTLPNAKQYQADDYFGQASSTGGMSMLPEGSDFSDNGLTTCFSKACSSGAAKSRASSQGERGANKRKRSLFEQKDGELHSSRSGSSWQLKLAPQLLQCPFKFRECDLEFAMDMILDWYEHSLTHFAVGGGSCVTANLPCSIQCCFCGKHFADPDGLTCWRERMHHVAWHHHAGYSLHPGRHDFALVEHLWQAGILDKADYRELKTRSSEAPRSVQNIPTPPDAAFESGAVTILNEGRSRGIK